MSRKDELVKLAQLFHSQARLTLDRAAKQTLRKLGDQYEHEAKKLQGQASADSHAESISGKHNPARAA
jgi:low affinity Fe/Cu permease